MHNSCGQVVYRLWVNLGKSVLYTHSQLVERSAWGKAYRLLYSLYYSCTQVLHVRFTVFLSVIACFYTVSTVPIKTTTY